MTDLKSLQRYLVEPLKSAVARAENVADAERILRMEQRIGAGRFEQLLRGVREMAALAEQDEAATIQPE